MTRRRTVVVGAASRHGATAAVAGRLAAVIGAGVSTPWVVRTPDLADLRVLDHAEAVVLGSAVHLGHWLRPALRLRRQAQTAPLLGLWLFSTGVTSHSLDGHPLVVSADDLVGSGRATEHRVFADRHDWTPIDDWGKSIAVRLDGFAAGTDVLPGGVRGPWADHGVPARLRTSPATESSSS